MTNGVCSSRVWILRVFKKRRDQGEPGWTWLGIRQHFRRAALALGQVQGGLSSILSDGLGGEDSSFRLF